MCTMGYMNFISNLPSWQERLFEKLHCTKNEVFHDGFFQ